MRSTRARSIDRLPRGFSLVELMVGIAVGLIGLLVVYRTLAVWDASTRTTVAGGDAQVAGTLAMFNIERDIKLAGMGFGQALAPVMGCQVTGNDVSTARVLNFRLLPVQIASAAGGPDSISVLAGNSSFFVNRATVTGVQPTSAYVSGKRDGFRNGDVVVLASAGALPGSATCQLSQITDNTPVDGHTVTFAAGNYLPDPVYGAASTVARFNGPAPASAPFNAGTMYSLGPTPTLNRWAINGGVLSRTDLLQGTPTMDLADGVVDMRAQYGVDANANDMIEDNEWTTAAPADWTTVRAIRVALLVRSSQLETNGTAASAAPVTATAPSWGASSNRTAFVMQNPADGTDWHNYRYRVYEKVIPLRNVIWGVQP